MAPYGARQIPFGDVPLRVMIVDDSIVVRTIFQRMLDDRPGFMVAAVARGVDQALQLLETLSVDLILLDVEMPGTDGLTALPSILSAGKGAHVVIVSSGCEDGAASSIRALALGASDTLLKPSAGHLSQGFAGELVDRLQRLGAARSATPVRTFSISPENVPESVRRDPIGCIAIGASTGGLLALAQLFEGLDRRCSAPILVTQHLPAEFMGYFADQLTEMAGRPAAVAVDGQPVEPGQLLVAPGTAHLSLTQDRSHVRVQHDRRPAASACQPSVDPTLDAVARVYGAGGVGVMLSGMGRDGLIGATRLSEAGGEVLAQDAASATVWGMPGAVVRAGIAQVVMPPAAIGRRLVGRWLASTDPIGDVVWK